MHDGMPYGRIQGQGQGHEPLKVWFPSIFKTYLLRHLQWELANDHKFDRAGFLIFVLVFVSRDSVHKIHINSELDQNLSGDFEKKIFFRSQWNLVRR